MAARTLKGILRWSAVLAVIVVVVVAGAVLALQTAPAKRVLADWISRLASKPGSLTIELRGLEGTIPTRFSIDELTIADPDGTWLRAAGIRAEASPRHLMRGRIHLHRVESAELDVARLPRLPDDGEPFEPPRVLRDLLVDALHVEALRFGRELINGSDASSHGASRMDVAEWSAPVIAEASGGYEFHAEQLTARVNLSAAESAGLLPASVPLRGRRLRLTGAVQGHLLRPKGALVLTADSLAYDDDARAGSLEVQVRGAPAERGANRGPYDLAVEAALREPRIRESIDSLIGPEVHLALKATLDPAAERIQPAAEAPDAAADAAGSPAARAKQRELVVRVSDVHLATPHLDVRGRLAFRGTPALLDGNLEIAVRDLDAAASRPTLEGDLWVEAAFSGRIEDLSLEALARSDRLKIGGGPSFSMTTSLSARDVADAPAGRLQADLSSSYGKIAVGADYAMVPGETLSLPNVGLNAEGATVTGSVVVDLRSNVAVGSLNGRFTDLSSLSPLVGAHLRGTGQLDARLFGDDDQQIEGSALVADVTYGGLRGVKVKKAKLDAAIRETDDRPGGELRLAAKDVTVRDVSIAALNASASGAGGSWSIDADAAGHYLQRFELRSAAVVETTEHGTEARVRTLKGSLAQRPLSLQREVVITREPDTLKVENVDVVLGDAHARGSWRSTKGRIDGAIEVDRLPLELLQLYDPAIDLRGTAVGRVIVKGTSESPDVQFGFDADSVEVGMKGNAQLPAVDVHGDGRWGAEGLVADARLVGGDSAEFELHARVPPGDGGVSLALDGTANVALLNGIGVLGEDRVGGVLHAKMTLEGTMARPRVSGDLVLTDASYENAAIGAVIEDANVRLVGSGSRLTLEQLEASDGGDGRIRAAGAIDLSDGLRKANYGVDVTLESARIARRDDLSAKASGQLRVAGEGAAPIVAGTITAERANIRIPDRLPPEVVEFDVVELNVEAAREDRYATPAPPDTIPAELDLEIRAPGRVFVRGSEIDTEWRADLRVTGTARDPMLQGKLELVRGSFKLLNVRLKAVEGTITFDGGEKIDPIIEIVGEAKKHDIVARVTVSGRVSKPNVVFASEPPLPQDEVLARLLFGKEPGQLSAVESVQLAAAVARLSGTGGGGPDPLGWLQRTFNVDTVDVTSADTAEGGSVLSVGKYVTDDVFVSVNQGLTDDQRSASVEVELTDNLSVQSKIGNVEGTLGLSWKWDY